MKRAAGLYYLASKKLPRLVLFLIVCGLLLALFSALNKAKDEMEYVMVSTTLRSMRISMQVENARGVELSTPVSAPSSLDGINPIRWVGSPPTGYQGECATPTRRELPESAWCFDPGAHELVFRPRNAENLQPVSGQENALCRELSWRVMRLPGGRFNDARNGWRIEATGPCRWNQRGN